MPSMTKPTRSSYMFGGYYTGTGGSGTQYYKADGTSARTWNLTSNTTLYAYWKTPAAPSYTYGGTSTTKTDSTYWYIYLKTTGTKTFKFNDYSPTVDIFLVGGGGGGGMRKPW